MSARNDDAANSRAKDLATIPPKIPPIDWSSADLPPDQFLYGRMGPWPQPAPSHPMKEAREVLNIPAIEQMMWNNSIGLRYLVDREGYPPIAAMKAVAGCNLPLPSDERFDFMMGNTCYQRFRRDVTEADRKRIGGNRAYAWKYDFSAMKRVEPMDDMHCAPVVCYFPATPTGEPRCELIEFRSKEEGGKSVVVARGNPAWNLAKVFALQGGAYHMLFVIHPALHFPMDSVNAITKSAVPHVHPLFQLLYPHTAYTLMQDNAVLEGDQSVVNANAQATWFDPFMGGGYNLKLLFGAGYAGLGDDPYFNGAYPQYDYTEPWMDPKAPYGRCLKVYFEKAFLPFAQVITKVIVDANPKDPYVTAWMNYNSACVHGFPSCKVGEALNPEILARVLAIFLWDVTVSHGADHYSFAQDISAPIDLSLPPGEPKISAAYKFLRIWVPPPKNSEEGIGYSTVDQVCNADDLYRTEMAQHMFFTPNAIFPNLINTYYPFTNEMLLKAQVKFHDDLQKASIEVSEQGIGFIPLGIGVNKGDPGFPLTIPASIQY